jgi:NADH dehydrogenase/NADH:ubiquinone oxidoreductase subunit G
MPEPISNKAFAVTINGKEYAAREGQTVLGLAREQGIHIPALCGHADFRPKGNCRVCLVEIEGARKLMTACSTPLEPGMAVFTDTPRVKAARNVNLELIYAEHIEKCPTCVWRFQCPLLRTAKEFGIKLTTFSDRKRDRATFRFANAVEIDGSQCIDCRNCVDACALIQKIDYLEIVGKGIAQEVVPTKRHDKHCILCGQCAVHCPVSAAQEQAEWPAVLKAIEDPTRIVVAQFAPSIRVAIGEDFGLPYGTVATE